MRRLPGAEWLLLAVAAAGLAVVLLARLGHPLLWQDEAETVMFATRIVEHGYPKVHGERNVVYEFGSNVALGIREELDAYIGTTWGQNYLAVPGVLWAADAADDRVRTLRLRLPFALLGAGAVVAFLAAVLPVFRGRPRRARLFAGLYLASAAFSISLVLHLREVRYYAPLLLCTAVLFGVHFRWRVFHTLGDRAYVAWATCVLFAVFHLFYMAWFVFAFLLAVETALVVRRRPAGSRVPALTGLIPIALSGLLLAPFLGFFETFSVATRFGESQGLGVAGVLANLRWLGGHLLRHEVLGAVVAVRALRFFAGRGIAGVAANPSSAVSDRLLAFAAGYALLSCANPLVYERYFVVLSPVLTLVVLLDAFALADVIQGAGRKAHVRVGAALAAIGIAAFLLRVPSVLDRAAEIAVPVRGPVDFIVDHVRSHHENPADLVIATNYAAHPLMYYLGSHVIVGLAGNNILRERQLTPDLIIPRRRWPARLPEVNRFLAKASYDETRLPVRDTHFNNIPSLSASRTTPDTHRFRTAHTSDPRDQVVVYTRRRTPERGEVVPWEAESSGGIAMGFHHLALATRDLKATHEFYTGPMGFRLVKVSVGETPEGGWAKHLFYDTGGNGLMAFWDLHDDSLPEDWSPAIATGQGLPLWSNHVAFDAVDRDDLEARKVRWLEHGVDVLEIDHGWCRSVYARDPNGILVEFCVSTGEFTDDDAREALRLLEDPSPEIPRDEAPTIVHRASDYRRVV